MGGCSSKLADVHPDLTANETPVQIDSAPTKNATNEPSVSVPLPVEGDQKASELPPTVPSDASSEDLKPTATPASKQDDQKEADPLSSSRRRNGGTPPAEGSATAAAPSTTSVLPGAVHDEEISPVIPGDAVPGAAVVDASLGLRLPTADIAAASGVDEADPSSHRSTLDAPLAPLNVVISGVATLPHQPAPAPLVQEDAIVEELLTQSPTTTPPETAAAVASSEVYVPPVALEARLEALSISPDGENMHDLEGLQPIIECVDEAEHDTTGTSRMPTQSTAVVVDEAVSPAESLVATTAATMVEPTAEQASEPAAVVQLNEPVSEVTAPIEAASAKESFSGTHSSPAEVISTVISTSDEDVNPTANTVHASLTQIDAALSSSTTATAADAAEEPAALALAESGTVSSTQLPGSVDAAATAEVPPAAAPEEITPVEIANAPAAVGETSAVDVAQLAVAEIVDPVVSTAGGAAETETAASVPTPTSSESVGLPATACAAEECPQLEL